jgi:predicted nucleic acid-binding protein
LILVDTNVFLEVLLGRSRAGDCRELLDRLASGDIEGVVTHFSVHSIEAIIGKHGREVGSFLRTVDQTPGLYVYETSISDEVAASLLTETARMDFDDALQYYVAKKVGAK